MKLREPTEFERGLSPKRQHAHAIGILKSRQTQLAKRSKRIPSDEVIELEKAWLSRRKRLLWADPERTKFFLELLRNPKLSYAGIVEKLNEKYQTTRFKRGSVAGRLRFLRGLQIDPENPWRYKGRTTL